ncbi:MAG: tetratricopeptide repeat protein [Phycisphaerales bacterium]|nr:tetratricopeptide repeat protein [Phycisphaerales bacterium]
MAFQTRRVSKSLDNKQVCGGLDTLTRVGAFLVMTAGLAIGGCGASTGGGYTTEHISAAKEKMNIMKSATEWEMAHQAFLAGELDKALKGVDRSIAINDNVPKSHVLKGRILMERGELEGAIESFNKAATLDPTFVDAPYYLGIAYERINRREPSLAAYQKAAELEPSNAQYVIAAAEMMIDLGRSDEAETYLTERGGSFENNAGVRQTLGHLAMMRSDSTKAVALFNEARLLAPDDNAILEDLARAQVAATQFADAESNLSRLLKSPDMRERRDLQHLRARCLVEVDRKLDAREALIALTQGQAGAADTEAWVQLGNLSYVLKDATRTRQCAARVIALAPDRVDGYVLRGLQLRRDAKPKDALASFDKALALGAKSDVLILKGMALKDLNRTDEARAVFAQALQTNPQDPAAAAMLTQVDEQN